jgi:hypothetical protein
LDAATGWDEGTDGDDEVIEDPRQPKRRVAPGATTRVQDPILRAAIERRSLDVATEYYMSLGADLVTELGKPYDLRSSSMGTSVTWRSREVR